MRGIQGLVVAGLLGMLGVVLNYIYLYNKTKAVQTVSYLGIKDGVTIKPGDKFSASDFAEVKIPKVHAMAGDLDKYVFLYNDLGTVTSYEARREYQGGELVYREDLRTPPASLDLESKEGLFMVSVNSQSYVPALINPGDRVLFVFPPEPELKPRTSPIGVDPTGVSPIGSSPAPSAALDKPQIAGPFTVKSVGARLGSIDAGRASRSSQERQIGILCKREGDRDLDAEVTRLIGLLNQGNGRNVSVVKVSNDD